MHAVVTENYLNIKILFLIYRYV